jgi:hypothetical protein
MAILTAGCVAVFGIGLAVYRSASGNFADEL